MKAPTHEQDVKRFWSKVNKGTSSDCWLWAAYCYPNGYGKFYIQRKCTYAHRTSYELNIGPIPSGLFVCHHCDVKNCVNPGHLFIGTQSDNLHDMVLKGRSTKGDRNPSRLYPERRACGERHGKAKLKSADVQEIRRRNANGENHGILASEFGVGRTQINRIIQKLRWSHLG